MACRAALPVRRSLDRKGRGRVLLYAMRLRLATPALAFALPFAVACAANAHPHVWIDVVTTFRFDAARLVAVGQTWRFDPYFSAFVAEQFDADRNGRLDAAEQKAVEAGAFAATAESGWFAHLRIDGHRTPWAGASGFKAELDDGVLVYDFVLKLDRPVDPVRQEVVVSPYDESYYIEVVPDRQDPVRYAGRNGCHYELRDDVEARIYYGMIKPPSIRLRCRALEGPAG